MNARHRTIYLSGPMKGMPDFNYPTFHRVAADLRRDGHLVYNPAEFPYDGPLEAFPLRQAFAEYARFICVDACTIAVLPNWEASQGVAAELALAKVCGLDVLFIDHAKTEAQP